MNSSWSKPEPQALALVGARIVPSSRATRAMLGGIAGYGRAAVWAWAMRRIENPVQCYPFRAYSQWVLEAAR